MSIRWTTNKAPQHPTRKVTDWKDVLPKSSTLQEIMTKVYEGAYVNGELSINGIPHMNKNYKIDLTILK